MTHSRTLLTCLFALVALFGRGALEYVAYDLATPEGMHEQVAAADVANLAYRTSTKMLFVRDTLLTDSVYIGVYEVTQAQAYKLGWTSSEPASENAGVAYGFNGTFAGFTANHKLDNFQLLTFPTGEQWEAYAGDKAKPCNVFGGLNADLGGGPYTPASWFECFKTGVSGSYTLPATHGAFDMYGNVAEFVSEGTFRGGYASASCTYASDLKAWASTTISAVDGFGMMGARLIYTPPEAITYTAIVTLDGKTVGEPISATPGTEVTLTRPTPAEGYRLQGPEVTPEDLTYTGTTFEMPTENVTFAYTSKPYATLQLIGGTASASEVVEGDTVTLTATPGAYQVFTQWTLPDGSSTNTDNPLSYTVPTVTPGATLTFTAAFQTYPRVLVYGGTAALTEGTDHGEGFYSPEAKLTLTPTAPEGYTFSKWTTEDDEALKGDTLTVGDYGSVLTVTAEFAESDTPGATETYIGEAPGNTETGALTLGYETCTFSTLAFGSNTFYCYQPQEATSNYASLALDEPAISYPLLSLSKSTKTLPLKRTRYDGSTYYIGIYETTVGHVAYLKALAGRSEDEDNANSLYPHLLESVAEATTYLGYLNKAFSLSATLPSKAQIEGITRAACLSDDRKYTGAGYYNETFGYGDEEIKSSMVFATTGGNATASVTVVGSRLPDPYGFYDLWGNANELWRDGGGTLWGGSCREPYANCNAYAQDGKVTDNWLLPSFRPAIEVPALLTVILDVDGTSKSTQVLPNQVIRLAPQVKSAANFLGWTATTASGTQTLEAASDGYFPYTVTEAVRLKATFTPKEALTVTYENCIGPDSVLPGATITLYAAEPIGEAPSTVEITPAEAATWNEKTGTLTFAETASGSVTVTASYPDPTPPKPGYKVYLQ